MGNGELQPQFAEALDSYQEGFMRSGNLAPRSRVEYSTTVRQFLLFLQKLVVHDLRRVEPRHIEAYLAQLDRQGMAGSTRRKKLTVLRTFFDGLRLQELVHSNPAKAVIPPQRDYREARVLSQTEYRRLLATVQTPRDRALIQLLLQTGITLSQIARLMPLDIDLLGEITEASMGTLRISNRRKPCPMSS